jgi:DNA-directed RNA polymerase subunit E'/Rpb7
MVHTSGIFIEVKSKLKVLILQDKMNDMKYDSINNTYKSSDDNSVLKPGDKIKVKIIGIRYQDKNISCYGQLAI